MARPRALRLASLLAPVAILVACSEAGPPTGDAVVPSARSDVSGEGVLTSEIVAGPTRPGAGGANPIEPTEYVVAEGKRLYQWYNCAGCHGLNGGGGMGPPFADGDWIYGSDPATLFQSIVQGRPGGMPAYRALADDHVWKLVAYVRTLGPVEAAGGEAESSAAERPLTGGSASRDGGR